MTSLARSSQSGWVPFSPHFRLISPRIVTSGDPFRRPLEQTRLLTLPWQLSARIKVYTGAFQGHRNEDYIYCQGFFAGRVHRFREIIPEAARGWCKFRSVYVSVPIKWNRMLSCVSFGIFPPFCYVIRFWRCVSIRSSARGLHVIGTKFIVLTDLKNDAFVTIWTKK